MAFSSEIIEVTAENLREHPGAVCFINPKNEYYQLKVNWLLEQFKKGLKIRSNLDLNKHKGLTMIYSKQCPWVARFIEEVKPVLSQLKLDPEMVEIKTYTEAQNAPAVYGAFTLIHDGKVLADRYISTTRFINIVRKEIK